MKASAIAQSAADLVGGDRKEAYGDVLLGLERIALMWMAVLTIAGKAPRKPISAHDVAQMMVSLKQARAYTGPLRLDNHIDEAGWAAIAGEAASRLASEAS